MATSRPAGELPVLAPLYGVSTRVLTQAVRRNRERFPGDFLFQLVADEVTILRSQTVISSLGHGGRRYRPYAFTEQGIAMLSSVLRSRRAIRVNVEWLDGANAGSASSGPRSRPALEHQLDAREIEQHGDVLRSQTVISNVGRGKRRSCPTVDQRVRRSRKLSGSSCASRMRRRNKPDFSVAWSGIVRGCLDGSLGWRSLMWLPRWRTTS